MLCYAMLLDDREGFRFKVEASGHQKVVIFFQVECRGDRSGVAEDHLAAIVVRVRLDSPLAIVDDNIDFVLLAKMLNDIVCALRISPNGDVDVDYKGYFIV